MSPAAADLLIAAVEAANDVADYPELERRAQELLEQSERVRDRAGSAMAHRYLGNVRLSTRDAKGAEEQYKLAQAFYESSGDDVGAAICLLAMGNLELELRMNLPEARHYVEAALPTIRAFGTAAHLATSLGVLGEIARLEGDYDLSMMLAAEALDIFEDVGDRTRAGGELLDIAHCRILKRDFVSARAVLNVAFAHLETAPNPHRLATYFEICFMFAVALREMERAALLLGFIDEYRDQKNVPRLLNLMPWFSRSIEALAASLPEDSVSALRIRGAALSYDDVRELAAKVAVPG